MIFSFYKLQKLVQFSQLFSRFYYFCFVCIFYSSCLNDVCGFHMDFSWAIFPFCFYIVNYISLFDFFYRTRKGVWLNNRVRNLQSQQRALCWKNLAYECISEISYAILYSGVLSCHGRVHVAFAQIMGTLPKSKLSHTCFLHILQYQRHSTIRRY